MTTSFPHQACEMIQKITSHKPTIGFILGSGLGPLADAIEDADVIPYDDLPGFPISTIKGHAGRLVIGKLCGVSVACLQGRVHAYEGTSSDHIKTLVRTLKLLGCEELIITNAAGSLREEVPPGDLVIIKDHINFQHSNPLIGPNDDEFGPRFVSLDDVYDADLRGQLQAGAKRLNMHVTEGVYLSVLGPVFETHAEIRAFRTLGADMVGMSTVPEAIVARHCGLRIAAVSAICNFGAGMSPQHLSHEVTLQGAQLAIDKLINLIKEFLGGRT